MKAISWFLVILIVSTSCDESEIGTGPHKKRISSIKSSSYGGSYAVTHFQYTGETVTQVRNVYYEPDPNGGYQILDDLVFNYKYSNGVLTRIEYSEIALTEFEYANGRLTGFRSGNGGSNYAYNATGNLVHETNYHMITFGHFTTSTEVVWDGNNIERCFRTLTSEYRGRPEPTVAYDTVLYEYGDQVNIFADSTYLGYTLTSVGSLFPFSQNNILKEKNSRTETYSAYDYTFSDDNYLIKITRSTVNNNVSTEAHSWTIEYEE